MNGGRMGRVGAGGRARYLRLVEPVLDDLYRFATRLEGDRVRAEDLLRCC